MSRAVRGFTALVLGLGLMVASQAQAQAQAAPPPPPALGLKPLVSPLDRIAIETVIDEYLQRNPAVVREALQRLETQEAQARERSRQEALLQLADALQRDPRTPVAGNPAGDVTVVEFFDYRCPHCKRAAGPLKELLRADPGVRLVYWEFPILGEDSLRAARAALAAHQQGQYRAYHEALMASELIDESALVQLAQRLRLDMTRWQADRQSDAVGLLIDRAYALAAQLDIQGTPAFVVGPAIIPGAADLPALQQAVAAARTAARAR